MPFRFSAAQVLVNSVSPSAAMAAACPMALTLKGWRTLSRSAAISVLE